MRPVAWDPYQCGVKHDECGVCIFTNVVFDPVMIIILYKTLVPPKQMKIEMIHSVYFPAFICVTINIYPGSGALFKRRVDEDGGVG